MKLTMLETATLVQVLTVCEGFQHNLDNTWQTPFPPEYVNRVVDKLRALVESAKNVDQRTPAFRYTGQSGTDLEFDLAGFKHGTVFYTE